MDRFQLLKACGLSLGAGLLAAKPVLPSDSKEPLPRFRPGADGQILTSPSEGKSWTRHASFGPDYEVLRVRQEREGVFADLKFQGRHDIRLRLDANGRDWKAL
ncbi:hypothetical protein [Holophaga foetida]|uniref:hypothetical protein n=1 Tax=Holophaga foetida TaxID=35839 RepID=UPI0002474662|nr:hypothetical protein [Holophaga foetida]